MLCRTSPSRSAEKGARLTFPPRSKNPAYVFIAGNCPSLTATAAEIVRVLILRCGSRYRPE
jgi:hypothetical protein